MIHFLIISIINQKNYININTMLFLVLSQKKWKENINVGTYGLSINRGIILSTHTPT